MIIILITFTSVIVIIIIIIIIIINIIISINIITPAVVTICSTPVSSAVVQKQTGINVS